MSFVLKRNNEQIAISGAWNPSLFGSFLGTSFPNEVPQDYIWEQDDCWLGWVDDPLPPPPSADELNGIAESNRAEAYRNESDPLFFKWQRGEATEQEWLDKVAEIKTRYPKE